MTLYIFTKRLLDIVASLLAIILLSPIMLIIAILIRLTSPGQAFFSQTRAGKSAKPFTVYKFRTMQTGVDPFGNSPKSGQDSRLTKIGKLLREHSLDELPQLFNVFVGSMTLVGPRPLYIQQIAEWNDRQKKRLLVKPGLTGLAQISGRGTLTREKKLALDVEYVENMSLGLDIKIIFKTVLLVFAKTEIYEKKYSQDQDTRS